MADAHEIPGRRYTYEANLDMTQLQFRAVKSTGTGLRITTAIVAGERGIGVVQNKPKNVGDAATVMLDGVTKAVAGAAITAGAAVTVDTSGRFVTAATGNRIWGNARSAAGAANELFALELDAAKPVSP
jgi:hypothetical protein